MKNYVADRGHGDRWQLNSKKEHGAKIEATHFSEGKTIKLLEDTGERFEHICTRYANSKKWTYQY